MNLQDTNMKSVCGFSRASAATPFVLVLIKRSSYKTLNYAGTFITIALRCVY